ncbi:phosphatidylserine lipase ABHD16A isoform X3 [Phyllobates terribilis]|uniref:phosphatidylserine lipase ABHD16A isoform X3 n=1 Tax=Phyllobates terribilis TaxID=111132 RepID=UPI003CCB007C
MEAGGEGLMRRWIRGFGLLYLCIRGPRLYRVYRVNGRAAIGRGRPLQEGDSESSWASFYQPKALEKHTDSILAWVSVLWTISYYSSPLVAFYMYRKGYVTPSRMIPLAQYGLTLMFLLAGIACLRGLGRWSNPQYIQFISILQRTKMDDCPENKKMLSNFNFDFRSWPVDFRWDEASSSKDPKSLGLAGGGVPLLKAEPRTRGSADGFFQRVQKLPCQIISYVVAHSFGRRMLYPGSVYLLQKALMPMLLQGQARLVEEYNGKRAKLLACDGNEIDTMFVDRRSSGEHSGSKLVICCEGNAGFYEVGCISTPLDAGYSVLGWNHPGFAGSTGVPFPQNEANAMDAVVQYAVYQLGFKLQDIIVYAWSIGGFTATWAAMSYPDVSAVVLDASFDDLVPLALKVMPESWRGLVTRTVRKYLNLNNAEQLCSFPNVMTEDGRRAVRLWLSTSTPEEADSVLSQYGVEEDWCLSVLESYKAENLEQYPWSVGEEMSTEGRQQLALYLAQKYLSSFEATHCTPLPASFFQMPWSI